MKLQIRDEPSWAKKIEPIIVLGRGVPAKSRILGRWAYCIAGIGNDGRWVRLYPLPIENGNRPLNPFDVIKPFIIKRHEDGRPESCRIDSNLVLKVGMIPDSERHIILERVLEPSFFMHDNSWRNKSLGLIKPLFLQINIHESPTLRYTCDYENCSGHTATFFDVIRIEARRRKLLASPEELENLLSQQDEEKLWFIVGTERQHPQIWMVVEVLISVHQTITGLQCWLVSQIKKESTT